MTILSHIVKIGNEKECSRIVKDALFVRKLSTRQYKVYEPGESGGYTNERAIVSWYDDFTTWFDYKVYNYSSHKVIFRVRHYH